MMVRILYVDDNPHDRALVRHTLEREAEGFALTEARDAGEFENLLDAGTFDLVLSDFHILGFTGLQILEMVRLRASRLPVIFVTGTGNEEVAVESMKRGAADYVLKTPSHIRRLPQTIHAVLELARAQEERHRAVVLQERLSAILEATPDVVGMIDAGGGTIYLNRAGRDLVGIPEEENILGARISDFHPAWATELVTETGIPATLRSGTWSGETALLTRDGREIPVSQVIIAHRDEDGTISHISTIMRDLTRRKEIEETLRLRERAMEASSNGIMITDAGTPDFPIIYINSAFERITGYSAAEVLGRDSTFLAGGDTAQKGLIDIREGVIRGAERHAVVRNYRKDGTVFWNELSVSPVRDQSGRVSHFITILNDITDRKRYEEQLEHQANHDPLTGLSNRNLLTDRLQQGIAMASRAGRLLAVLVLDLDRFKVINDSLGHSTGDALLCSVAHRLARSVRAEDTVARLGGDEFVITIGQMQDEDDAVGVACKLQEVLAPPYPISGRKITVNASIGISLFPRDGEDEGTLIRNADVAMYKAKSEGGGTFRFYAPEMNARAMETLEMESALRLALPERQLLLHYQPKVCMWSGRVLGCEALVRWQHPERGMLPPEGFIPLAEETGLIVPIGAMVLQSACAQARKWTDEGLPPVTMAVNLSARQFRQADLLEQVRDVLQETGMDPARLELELTESMIMHDPGEAARTMSRLKEIGVRFALDDFGTGYSSLNCLRHFPVDCLKIDRSFVSNILSDQGCSAIAATIIDMSHRLGLEVVAEGVETEDQLNFLRESRCDAYQGFFFSQAVPHTRFAALLLEGRGTGRVGGTAPP